MRAQPDLAAAQNNLGNAYRALERWPEARQAYAEATRLDPKLPWAWANLGLALIHEDRTQDAAAALARAAELADDADPKLWRALANAHTANEDFAAAISLLRACVGADAGSGRFA